ncbi:hypothetical protein C0993_006202 [Termitomyces sp. T159_Od127]|nr:hypothetical protein C0993_006202 [Termitomyces sp. T159_Od127]
MARKSSKKVDEPVQSVLKGGDTGAYQLHASSDDRVNAVTGSAGLRPKSGGAPFFFQQTNAAKEMAPSNVVQSRSRMKSATGRKARTPSRDSENLARKSGRTGPQESTSSRASSQVGISQGSYAPFRSAGTFLSGTNAIAGPSHSPRHDFLGTEIPTIDKQSLSALSSPSVNRSQPNRKVVQSYGELPHKGRRPSVITPSESVALSFKSGPRKPHWQLDDEERAREEENISRLDRGDQDFIKRVGPTRRASDTSHSRRFKGSPKHLKRYLGRNLTLKKEDEPDSGSDSDSPMEIDGQPRPPRNTVRLQQAGFKAARKREWPQPPVSDPDLSAEEASSDEVDELDSSDSSPYNDQDDSEGIGDSDIEEVVITARRQRSLSPAEIEILPGPPRPPSPLSVSEGMMTAIADLSLSSVRMQSTRQLPFLRRNLRRGFKQRCRQLDVPTEPTLEQDTKLRVRYDYRSEIVRVRLRDWTCPLCELHGFFPTREMLACHLSWDHEKATTEWTRNRSGAWCLRLTVTDPPTELEEEE